MCLIYRDLPVCVLALFLVACAAENNPTPGPIRLNTLGFFPLAEKIAIVSGAQTRDFHLVDPASDEIRFTGVLGEKEYWEYSGEEVRTADFSAFTREGTFLLRVPGLGDSELFSIRSGLYDTLLPALQKSFYYQRCSYELTPAYAGAWARPAGHPDTEVLVDSSAATDAFPTGTHLAAPGGWYDAGDYGKYVQTACVSAYYLMAAYESEPVVFAADNREIPESGNGVPDLLEEIRRELEWLLHMQHPDEGFFYHKLVSAEHAIGKMPHEDLLPRAVTGIETGSSLAAAATLAMAARVYMPFDSAFAAHCLDASLKAWKWARRHPIENTTDEMTAPSSTDDPAAAFADEFSWAATEIYLSSGADSLYNFGGFLTAPAYRNTPTYRDTEPFAVFSLVRNLSTMPTEAEQNRVKQRFLTYAERFMLHAREQNPYRVAMGANEIYDFRTSANEIHASMGLMCMQAYTLSGDTGYLNTAIAAMDYLLGRNAVARSFITGFGHRPPRHIHKIIDENDGIEAPIPGFVAGGPQAYELRDGCGPTALPATTYFDKWGCHSTNEPTLTIQSATLYLAGWLSGELKNKK